MSDVGRPQLSEDENLFLSQYGVRPQFGWRGYNRLGRLSDLAFDARLRMMPGYRKLLRAAMQLPARRVHIAAVDVPARRDDLERLISRLSNTRHHVTTSIAPIGDRGKFENLNLALSEIDLDAIDWLVLTDDDIDVPDHFTDLFIYVCEASSLMAAMPAHRFHSHCAYSVTQRSWNSVVRTTRYVETGPLTAFKSPMFRHVVPFPVTRWSWGIDLLWSDIAERNGWSIGVVDATPVEHLRPVSMSYDRNDAAEEAIDFLRTRGVVPRNREFLRTTRTFSEV